ncbi:Gfo/Idh/MocA family protein [Haliscomenobacter hydrossis]|uniref:Oxidoreductase domain protein n=1 Tax=Haliscomenobacter hydrossis (strain ATCC 27775 / DSM 1100 / LMG 10767 / O) TaxID=760192 RepID=F4L4S6_HALH1|nr:Gfo/Idh/MocA family oxidoreductase [Haliscomenobacter hydrossis]AEE53024.1 oxidoreductase domain protein [Haliscomenobacter hydrossis DSM 1100]
MKNSLFNRRRFLKETATAATGMAILSSLPQQIMANPSLEPRIKFSVIGINHGHIYGMVDSVTRGGGQLVAFYAKEPDLAAAFAKRYPTAKLAANQQEILEDNSIQLILSAGIPVERAPLGVEVMKHGKDYLVDKPGITSLAQLKAVRAAQQSTKRIYSIMYSERHENRATVKAGELVKAGAIGKVIQTIGMGPHRMNTNTRPAWFFDRKYYGGIITDIASHQFDQFLFFTGSTQSEIVAAQVGNVNHPQYPEFEDFGDVMIKGNNGTGYIRVDWFTPDGLKTWGDGRLTILGTEGYIEIRKNIDIASHDGGNHLYLVNQKETKYIDCSKEPLPFGTLFVDDVLNRTETAMPQAHCLLATEMALKAQKMAKQIQIGK